MKYPAIISPMMLVAALQRSADISTTLEDDFMPLPDLNDAAAWATFVADPKPNLKGVRDEQLVRAYNHIAPIKPREKQTGFLYDRLELRFTDLVSRHLNRYNEVAKSWITNKAVTTLQDGLIDPHSSINSGLQEWFNVTVKRRRIDAQELWNTEKDKHSHPPSWNKEALDVEDLAAAALVEAYTLFRQVIEKLDAKQRAVLASYFKGILQQAAAQMSKSTRNRKLGSALDKIYGLLTEEFAHSLHADAPRFTGPPITAMEVCLIGFSIACPQPSEADIERWSRDFPKFAELIRECAEDMALNSAEIAELHDADA